MPFDESVEKENLEAYEKLLIEKEQLNDNDLTRYRYYVDLYGSYEYRWYTHKQLDGKYKAEIIKISIKKGWKNSTVKQTRSFAKKKSAMKWLLARCKKDRQHQKIVLDAREKRKQEKAAAKPKLTNEQKALINAQNKIDHYKKLQAKADKKIKALNTRKRTYQKRIKYYQKRTEQIKKNEVVLK